MIFGFLSVGLKATAEAQDTAVDNSVKYGEKYSCAVKTADEKNYLLDIEWSAEPAKFSTFPKWEEKLNYLLSENGQQIDSASFSDFGFGSNNTELTFADDKYLLTGNSSFATRVGTDSSMVNIEIKKSYDNNGETVLSVIGFKAEHIFDRYYGSVKIKTIDLTIVSSKCEVAAKSK